jgi:hypothetical protein
MQAASMVPEYLTPTNGGLLSPGQLVALSRAVLGGSGTPDFHEKNSITTHLLRGSNGYKCLSHA